MKVIIRKAKKKDSESILKLIKELAFFEGEADEVILKKKVLKETDLVRKNFLTVLLLNMILKL